MATTGLTCTSFAVWTGTQRSGVPACSAFQPSPLRLIAAPRAGHRFAALVIAGSAQSVGFGAFQRRLWFRGGPMVLATLGMALSAAVGELAGKLPWVILVLVTFWAFCYGMSGAISSPASWVGQQCCLFLVVSSAVQGTPHQAALRAAGVLIGGFPADSFASCCCGISFLQRAAPATAEPGIHTAEAGSEEPSCRTLTFRSSTASATRCFWRSPASCHKAFHTCCTSRTPTGFR